MVELYSKRDKYEYEPGDPQATLPGRALFNIKSRALRVLTMAFF